ncbi:MAG: hypothetical protein ACR2QM_20605 [Longimicrobiales bacterium]
MEIGLELFGKGHVLVTDDSYPAEVVGDLFPHYVVDPAPAQRAGPSITIELEGGAYVVSSGGTSEVALRSELPTVLEHVVTGTLLDGADGFVHLHAAGTVRNGKATLVLGDSGSGKSSTAAAWSTAGHPVLGDDVVFLDRSLRVHPFRKPLKVVVERATQLGISPERTPYWEAGSSEAWYDPAQGGGWADAAPVDTLAFLNRTTEDATRIDALTPAQCIQRIVGQFMRSGGRPAEWIESLFELSEQVRCVEVTFSDSQDAAAALVGGDW